MSLRLEMLQVARLSPRTLGESVELIKNFLLRQQNDDGGFRDRAGRSDLYYTVFGIDALLALQAEPGRDRVRGYLESFGTGAGLDFVHLCCLARSWAALVHGLRPSSWGLAREAVLSQLEGFRAADGGYHPAGRSASGTAYGAYLALGAYQDLQKEMPDSLRLVQSLKGLETADGAWANERVPQLQAGSTNATAAAVTVLRNLSMPIHASVGDWLLARGHPHGGFLASPNAPIPDLLSTATALHALSGLQRSIEPIRECCLDFIDSLWTNEGAFYGHWNDEALDCEYAFYALLALGHLSV